MLRSQMYAKSRGPRWGSNDGSLAKEEALIYFRACANSQKELHCVKLQNLNGIRIW